MTNSMKLRDWEDFYSSRIVNQLFTGQKYIIDNTEFGRTNLWHLIDYNVSSVSGGCIWLIPIKITKEVI